MTLIPLPTGAKFKTVDWTLEQPTLVNRSPYSGARAAMSLPGSLWRVAAQVIPITREVNVRPWRAFLAALKGRANTFLMPARNIDLPAAAYIPNYGGALAAGVSEYNAPGWVGFSDGTILAKKGTFIRFPLENGSSQLGVLTEDAVVSSEAALVKFAPPLRRGVNNGVAIWVWDGIEYMYAEMNLVEDSFIIQGSEGQGFTVAFEAEEAY